MVFKVSQKSSQPYKKLRKHLPSLKRHISTYIDTTCLKLTNVSIVLCNILYLNKSSTAFQTSKFSIRTAVSAVHYLNREGTRSINMRVAIFITILLFACCLSADAGWFGRRRTTVNCQCSNSVSSSVVGKRSVESGRYDVTLLADPCDFEAYDGDQNGEITVDEFIEKFGTSGPDAVRLFDDLDTDPENDVITAKEFSANAHIINGCAEDE